MSRIIEIEQGTRCHACDIVVGVCREFYCSVDGERRAFSCSCNIGTHDDVFVTNHDLYKELLQRCEELEQKLEGKC